MKKRTLILIIILLGAATWAGATYLVGSKVEKNYAALLEQYRRFGPISISGSNYERGFFHATAETALHFEVPNPETQKADIPESLTIILQHRLKHGPFPGAAPALATMTTHLTGIKVNGITKDDLFDRFPQLHQPLALTRIAFDGTTQSRLELPPLSMVENDVRFDWKGLDLKSTYFPTDKAIQGTFSTPGMRLKMENGQLDWSGGNGRFDLKKVLPSLYVGTQEISLGAFALRFIPAATGEVQSLAVDNLNISANSRFDGRQVHYQQSLNLAGLKIEDQSYGPGLLTLELNNLAAQPLSDFQTQLKELYLNNGRVTPEQLPAQLLPLYSQLFIGLAAGEPEVVIRKLEFSTPKGSLDGRARLKYTGHQSNTGMALLLAPVTLLQNLEADAELSVAATLAQAMATRSLTNSMKKARANGTLAAYSDEDLAALAEQQYRNQLEGLLQQNFIVREGNTLKAAIDFNQGTLKLNGRILPLL